MCVTGDFILFSPSRLRIRTLFAEGPRTSLSTVGCCRRMHPTEVWMLSISCRSYATSLIDGVVLVAPCVMGIRWQKGIIDKGPDPKEPETSISPKLSAK